MEPVLIAFEGETKARRIKEILERAGVASCLICRTAAEVRRQAGQQRVSLLVCGYKFPDGTAQALFDDLPPSCAMLMLAMQSRLDMCESEEIYRLATPVSPGDLIAEVEYLLLTGRGAGKNGLAEQAKRKLMKRRGMTEEEAHRFLQKQSMDRGIPLTEAARQVLRQA